MRLTRITAAAVAIGAALTIAACGGSNSADTHTSPPVTVTRTQTQTQPARTTAATQPATKAATATAPAPTTVTTGSTVKSGGSAVTANPCVASDLNAKALGQNGAAGTLVMAFELTNTSNSPCETYGWPGVAFVSKAGAVLETVATRTSSDVLGSTPAQHLNLKPGDSASFRIVFSDESQGGGSKGCTTVTGLQIIAPNDTSTLRVSFPPQTACGKTGVSPVLSGTDASPGV